MQSLIPPIEMGVMEQTPPLEKPVDPDTYFVGPGDVFIITLWGDLSNQFSSTITPEGTILIPTIGEIDLKDLCLSDVKGKITEAVLDRYRNTTVSVTLIKTRIFKVSVTGAVFAPGIYIAMATDRVSSLIEKAGGLIGYLDFTRKTSIPDLLVDDWQILSLQDTLIESTIKASKRRIILKRRNGETINVDLLKYERAGVLDGNPQLLDGDVIYVPVAEKDINTCGIFGAVTAPGYFEYFEHDRISDLLLLGNNITLNADSSSANLVRFDRDRISTSKIDIDLERILENPECEANLKLLPDDRVFINSREPYHRKRQVTVTGEIKFPGVYWIENDSTFLSEILIQAGNPTSFADLSNSEMFRKTAELKYDPEFERLKETPISQMSYSEYEYLKLKFREKSGSVSIDLDKLIKNKNRNYDVMLRNEDIINIPRLTNTVDIQGEVSNPGLISFKQGKDIEYYIERAGGFSERARKGKIRIIRGKTGEWVKPGGENQLRPGDTIWIPEKPAFNFWEVAKEVVLFTGNLATVYLVLRQAAK
ncbi:MAG: hypothetical protein GY855_00600 [candidate division Zixibacteria bacterium]|nr:hypothetical protein [candidate division Zixibacteria bacterium]